MPGPGHHDRRLRGREGPVTQRAVVVGAGLAGLRTAEALRAQGYTDAIVVVGDEPSRPYNRPPLSKEALAGEFLHDLAHERLAYRVRKAAADVEWRLGSASSGPTCALAGSSSRTATASSTTRSSPRPA